MSNMRETYRASLCCALHERNEESALEDLDNALSELQEDFREHFQASVAAIEGMMGGYATVTITVQASDEIPAEMKP